MINSIERKRNTLSLRIINSLLTLTFISTSILPPSYAQSVQTALGLPMPGAMVNVSQGNIPTLIKGITVHPENPLQFDFIVDNGDSRLQGEELRAESMKLVKYFMATLTVPEKDLWVNLSPYEKNRIIPEGFGKTDMGRDLLAQDYMLKQLSSSLMFPENELGKKFWEKMNAVIASEAKQSNLKEIAASQATPWPANKSNQGGRNDMADLFHKIWIVPDRADVVEYNGTAYVKNSHMKVMLKEDLEAAQELREKNEDGSKDSVLNASRSTLPTSLMKETLLPAIEKEINEGKNFAQLRQVYNAMVLATWYKVRLKESLLSKIYVDQNKVKGIDLSDPKVTQKIYDQYIEAFQKGVYNYIKEEYDPVTQEVIPQKYFSGGYSTIGQDGKDMAMRVSESLEVVDGSADLTPVQLAELSRVSAPNRPSSNTFTVGFLFAEGPEQAALRNSVANFGQQAPTNPSVADSAMLGKTVPASELIAQLESGAIKEVKDARWAKPVSQIMSWMKIVGVDVNELKIEFDVDGTFNIKKTGDDSLLFISTPRTPTDLQALFEEIRQRIEVSTSMVLPLGQVLAEGQAVPKYMWAWVVKNTAPAGKATDADVLSLELVPTPEVREDEVLLQVFAVSSEANEDWMTRQFPISTLKIHNQAYQIPGNNPVGMVVGVGAQAASHGKAIRDLVGVHNLDTQDPLRADMIRGEMTYLQSLYGYDNSRLDATAATRNGGHAQFIVAKWWQAMPKPSHVSFEEMASYLLRRPTIVHNFRVTRVNAGDTLLTTGLGGSTGVEVVLEGIRIGARRIIGTVSDVETAQRMESMSTAATQVVTINRMDYDDLKTPPGIARFKAKVLELNDGRPVDYALDFVGGNYTQAFFDLTKKADTDNPNSLPGRFTSYGAHSGKSDVSFDGTEGETSPENMFKRVEFFRDIPGTDELIERNKELWKGDDEAQKKIESARTSMAQDRKIKRVVTYGVDEKARETILAAKNRDANVVVIASRKDQQKADALKAEFNSGIDIIFIEDMIKDGKLDNKGLAKQVQDLLKGKADLVVERANQEEVLGNKLGSKMLNLSMGLLDTGGQVVYFEKTKGRTYPYSQLSWVLQKSILLPDASIILTFYGSIAECFLANDAVMQQKIEVPAPNVFSFDQTPEAIANQGRGKNVILHGIRAGAKSVEDILSGSEASAETTRAPFEPAFKALEAHQGDGPAPLWRIASAPVFTPQVVPLSNMVADRTIFNKDFAGLLNRTPLILLEDTTRKTGMRVFVKDEGQQHTGSFKPRILAQFLKRLTTPEAREEFFKQYQVLTTGTTGNQGQAVAWIVQQLSQKFPELRDLKARIFTAVDTPAIKERKMRDVFKADVEKMTGQYEIARNRAIEEGKKDGVLYMTHSGDVSVSSYGTLGLEIVDDLVEQWKKEGKISSDFSLDEYLALAVLVEAGQILSATDQARFIKLKTDLQALEHVAAVVPIGAGGVATGVLMALKYLNPKVTVIGVSTNRTMAMQKSLLSGRQETVETKRGVEEDGINVDQIEQLAIDAFQGLADGVVTVPFEIIPKGLRAHLREGKIKSEGASVLPWLAITQFPGIQAKLREAGVSDVVLVSTGQNIDDDRWESAVMASGNFVGGLKATLEKQNRDDALTDLQAIMLQQLALLSPGTVIQLVVDKEEKNKVTIRKDNVNEVVEFIKRNSGKLVELRTSEGGHDTKSQAAKARILAEGIEIVGLDRAIALTSKHRLEFVPRKFKNKEDLQAALRRLIAVLRYDQNIYSISINIGYDKVVAIEDALEQLTLEDLEYSRLDISIQQRRTGLRDKIREAKIFNAIVSELGADSALLSKAGDFIDDLEHPYFTAMKTRITGVQANVPESPNITYDLTRAVSVANRLLNVTLETPFGKKTFRLPSSRIENNIERGPAKGGIRYLYPTDLMKDKKFVEALAQINQIGATEEEFVAFLSKWVEGDAQALALGMTVKVAGIGLPLGGGKGAVYMGGYESNIENGKITWKLSDDVLFAADKSYAKANKARVARAHSLFLAQSDLAGVEIDIPAPDVNTTGEIMSWYEDELIKFYVKETSVIQALSPQLYQILSNIQVDTNDPSATPYLDATFKFWSDEQDQGRFVSLPFLGVYTGKNVSQGGALGRTEATGEGVIVVTKAFFKSRGESIVGKKFAVQGFGNVGSFTSVGLARDGGKVVVINDISGTYIKEEGWTYEELKQIQDSKTTIGAFYASMPDKSKVIAVQGDIKNQADAKKITAAVLEADVDVLIPAALEGQITAENAGQIKAKVIIEAANGPVTPEADAILLSRDIPVVNDTLANAGGVAVSFMETEQAKAGKKATLEDVSRREAEILTKAFNQTQAVIKEFYQKGKKITFRQAYDIVSIRNVLSGRKARQEMFTKTMVESANRLNTGSDYGFHITKVKGNWETNQNDHPWVRYSKLWRDLFAYQDLTRTGKEIEAEQLMLARAYLGQNEISPEAITNLIQGNVIFWRNQIATRAKMLEQIQPYAKKSEQFTTELKRVKHLLQRYQAALNDINQKESLVEVDYKRGNLARNLQMQIGRRAMLAVSTDTNAILAAEKSIAEAKRDLAYFDAEHNISDGAVKTYRLSAAEVGQALVPGTSGVRLPMDGTKFTLNNVARWTKAEIEVLIDQVKSKKLETLNGKSLRVLFTFGGRAMSEEAAKKAASVALSYAKEGVDVTLGAGISTTPAAMKMTDPILGENAYDVVLHFDASHNVDTDNGWKMFQGGVVSPDSLTSQFAARANDPLSNGYYRSNEADLGQVPTVDVAKITNERYAEMFFNLAESLQAYQAAHTGATIVIDGMYGASGAGGFLEQFKKIGAKVVRTEPMKTGKYKEEKPTGYKPEPVKNNLSKADWTEFEANAAVGSVYFAIDGDADRLAIWVKTAVGIVEELNPNKLGVILNSDSIVAGRAEGKSLIVKTLPTTAGLDAVARRYGKSLIKTPVGSKNFAPYLNDAVGAVEQSGHQVSDGEFDSAVYQALRLVEIMGRTQQLPTEYHKYILKEIGFEGYVDDQDNRSIKVDLKDAIVAELRSNPSAIVERLKGAVGVEPTEVLVTVPGADFDQVVPLSGVADFNSIRPNEGIYLQFGEPGTWLQFRFSGTEGGAVVRVYTEASNEALRTKMHDAVFTALNIPVNADKAMTADVDYFEEGWVDQPPTSKRRTSTKSSAEKGNVQALERRLSGLRDQERRFLGKSDPTSARNLERIQSDIADVTGRIARLRKAESTDKAMLVNTHKFGVLAQRVTTDRGAKTGFTHINEAIEAGADGIIAGHSEARANFRDSDDEINKQIKAAFAQKLKTVILAVGETAEEKEAGRSQDVIKDQIVKALAGVSAEDAKRLIIAYEPRWAIAGSGGAKATPATAADAQSMAAHIGIVMEDLYGNDVSKTVRVLYGGSVDGKNAKDFMVQRDVDGLLVGGKSASIVDFRPIIEAAIAAGIKEGRVPYVGGNWKTYEIKNAFPEFAAYLDSLDPSAVEIGIAPDASRISDLVRAGQKRTIEFKSSPGNQFTVNGINPETKIVMKSTGVTYTIQYVDGKLKLVEGQLEGIDIGSSKVYKDDLIVYFEDGNLTVRNSTLTYDVAIDNAQVASKEEYGGINFDPSLLNLQIKRDSRGIPLPVNQQSIGNIKIDGLTPIIINIQPVNLRMKLGLKTTSDCPTGAKDCEQMMGDRKARLEANDVESLSYLN